VNLNLGDQILLREQRRGEDEQNEGTAERQK
jgi:hypothetical protein